MIVDVHVHWGPPPASSDEVQSAAQFMKYMADCAGCPDASIEQIAAYLAYQLDDPHGEKIVERMEQNGVDRAIVFPLDWLTLDDDGIMAANKAVGEIGARFPEKAIPFASLHPGRPKAPDMVRRCIEEFGLRGMKWHPGGAGFWPNDSNAYALLKVLDEYRLPLVTHTGHAPAPIKAKFSHPLLYDEVLMDFPNITIIAAHSGYRWWREWAAIAEWRANLCGCLTVWQLLATAHRAEFRSTLRQMIDLAGVDRILWGTDSPGFDAIVPIQDWIGIMNDLPEDASDGIQFTKEEVDAILGGNAKRLFGL